MYKCKSCFTIKPIELMCKNLKFCKACNEKFKAKTAKSEASRIKRGKRSQKLYSNEKYNRTYKEL